MYHWEARLPIDVELLPPNNEHGPTVEDYVDAMSKVQDGVKPKVMANISKAQEYQKQYYNQRHTTQVCCVYVLVYFHTFYGCAFNGMYYAMYRTYSLLYMFVPHT